MASTLVHKGACTLFVELNSHNEIRWGSIYDNLVAEMPNLDEAKVVVKGITHVEHKVSGSLVQCPLHLFTFLRTTLSRRQVTLLLFTHRAEGLCLANVQMMRCHACHPV